MKFLVSLLAASSASAFTVPSTPKTSTTSLSASGLDDLKGLSTKLNPIVNYFDPLNLVNLNFYDMGQDATIGFLRHAEIKHGRVAMAAFVGYCVQSNFHFPWPQTTAGDAFPSIDLSPEQQWDAIPAAAKWQILVVILGLEIWDEASGGIEGRPHYMKGGRPGDYPSFSVFRDSIHWVLDLYDPFGLFGKMSAEKKEERLVMEINNGRLAMIGIMGFLAADKVPGSVPLLGNIAIPYDGNCMSPFEAGY